MNWPSLSMGATCDIISNAIAGLAIFAFLYTVLFTLVDFLFNHYRLRKYRYVSLLKYLLMY